MAIEDYGMALQLDPKQSADVYYNRGSAFAQIGQMNDAVKHLTAALRLDPDNAKLQTYLAVTLGEMGNYSKSIDAFTEAIRTDPKNAELYTDRGNTYVFSSLSLIHI